MGIFRPKPPATKASVAANSSNIEKLQNGLAIIVDGDTCSTNVAVGRYAYIKNNTHGLADGLYTNTSSSVFPTSGGTADSTVFTSVSDGGLNKLTDHLAQFSVGFIGELIGETWVLSSVSQTKTVTEDCWVYAQIGMRNGQGLVGLVNGVSVFNYLELSGNSSAAEKSTIFPMKNGQTLSFASNGNLPSYPYIRFYKMLK